MAKKSSRKSTPKSKPKAATKPARKKPARVAPARSASKPLRRFIIQVSACAQGDQKPEGDRSELRQFLFVVEARRVEALEEPLLAAIEEAREDENGMLHDAKRLYIDWILDPERGTGLQWECSTRTGIPEGPSRLHRAHGIYIWSKDKAGKDTLFLDLTEDAVDADVDVVDADVVDVTDGDVAEEEDPAEDPTLDAPAPEDEELLPALPTVENDHEEESPQELVEIVIGSN